MYFCTNVYFKIIETETSVDADKISRKKFPDFYEQAVGKIALKILLTLD
jgi:hypothetical protein